MFCDVTTRMGRLLLIILICGYVLGTPTYITTGSNSLLIQGKELSQEHGSMPYLRNQIDETPSSDVASTYSSILGKVSTLPQNVISQMISYIEMKLNYLGKSSNQALVVNHTATNKRHAFYSPYQKSKNNPYRKFPTAANSHANAKQIEIGKYHLINTHSIKDKETSEQKVIGKPIHNNERYNMLNNGQGHQKNTTHTNNGLALGKFNQQLKNEHGIDLDKLSPKELHKLLGFLKSLQKNNTTDINGKFKPNIGDICCPIG